MRNDTKKTIEALEALCHLARTNFPASTDLIIKTDGKVGSGSLMLPVHEMAFLLELAKANGGG